MMKQISRGDGNGLMQLVLQLVIHLDCHLVAWYPVHRAGCRFCSVMLSHAVCASWASRPITMLLWFALICNDGSLKKGEAPQDSSLEFNWFQMHTSLKSYRSIRTNLVYFGYIDVSDTCLGICNSEPVDPEDLWKLHGKRLKLPWCVALCGELDGTEVSSTPFPIRQLRLDCLACTKSKRSLCSANVIWEKCDFCGSHMTWS